MSRCGDDGGVLIPGTMKAIRCGLLCMLAALFYSGCAIQYERRFFRGELASCEAPPGSLVRIISRLSFDAAPGREEFLPKGTVVRVLRVRRYKDNWNGDSVYTEAQIVSGPRAGTSFTSSCIVSDDEEEILPGTKFRFSLNRYYARLISRPAEGQ